MFQNPFSPIQIPPLLNLTLNMKGYRCLSFCLNKSSLEVSNLYTQTEQEKLLKVLGPATNITRLHIDSSIAVISSFNFLPSLMARMPLLEELVIDNRRKKIDPGLLSTTLQALLKAHRDLQCGSRIRLIRLRSVKIIRESANTLSELLPLLPELEGYEIIGCDYESDECYGIVSSAIMNSKNLLHLVWTKILTKDTKALNAVVQGIETAPILESLEFEYNRGMNKVTMQKLTDIIRKSKTLKNLKLYLNSIPSEIIREFAGSLAVNKTVTHLILNLRNLPEESNKDILVALRANSTLKKLHLVSEGMCTGSTVNELAALLETNRSIEKVKFLFHGDYPSMERLKEAIAKNDVLKSVNIKVQYHPTSQFEGTNLIPLLEGLTSNGKIEKAVLPIIPSDIEMYKKLKAFIESSKRLRKLKLVRPVGLAIKYEQFIGEAIVKNKSIKELIYKSDEMAITLKKLSLELCDHLIKLKLNGHRSKDFPTPNQFTSIIKANKQLESLKLLQCNISNKSAIEIAKSIEVHPSLKKLNLKWILADMSGILRLSKAMKRNRRLRSVNIQNSIMTAQLSSFMDVWTRNTKVFSGNNRSLSFELMSNLLTRLSNNERLKYKLNKKMHELEESYKYCVDGATNTMFPKDISSVSKVIVSNAGLNPTQGKAIAKIVAMCPQVESVSFMGNEMKIKGAIGIALIIKKSTRLTELDISFCRIDYKGALFIAEALGLNSSVIQLNMRGNQIQSDGAAEIVRHISKNQQSKLESINMNSCQIDNSFIKVLKDCKEIGTKLKNMGLAMNGMDKEFVRELIELYKELKWKIRVSLSLRNHSAISKEIAEAGCKELIRFII